MQYLVSNNLVTQDAKNKTIRCVCTRGDIQIMKYLIRNGADIHTDDDFALRFMSKVGNFNTIQYLILHGADISRFPKEYLRLYSDERLIYCIVNHKYDGYIENDKFRDKVVRYIIGLIEPILKKQLLLINDIRDIIYNYL